MKPLFLQKDDIYTVLLEELPDDDNPDTDIEDDNEAEQVEHVVNEISNFDLVFQQEISDLETDRDGQVNDDIVDFVEDQPSTSSVLSNPVEDGQSNDADDQINDPDFVPDIGSPSMASVGSGQVPEDEQNTDVDFDKDAPSTSSAIARPKTKVKQTKTMNKPGKKEPRKKKDTKQAKVKKVQPDRKWKKRETPTVIPNYLGKNPGPVDGVFESCNSATDVFLKTLEPAIDNIVYQSNLYP